MTPEPVPEVKCRACGCSASDPCPGGCGWVELGKETGLCSVCAEMREMLFLYLIECRQVTGASLTMLTDEAADMVRAEAAVIVEPPANVIVLAR